MAGEEFLKSTSGRNVHVAKRSQAEILRERFERLPEADKSLFQNGSYFLALNGSLCGLISNSLFRRVLHITQARFISSLPMAVLPFISVVVIYDACIRRPLMEGDLNCATCVSVRGGLIGGVIGCLYPALLALPLNAALASRYFTSPMPENENLLRYWTTVSKPVFKKMKFAIILQVAFGMYMSSKHHDIYIKMLQLPESRRDS
ncbi:transmembrane protein 126A-like [Hemicordylus capensis]|uniref:transmembrane protein 126A-like n=1 Tax=Hemicordylus capensis TaxID=884348 RepID=UPI002302506B|nr:transmembrane protein 126A-like [Hemicordylus capensis]